MKVLLAILLSMILFNTQAQEPDQQQHQTDVFPQVSEMWLRAAPPTAKMLAAYVTLENQTGHDLTLVGAYAPDFGVAEIHKTIEIDGLLKMREQKALSLPDESRIKMQPGGLHIMLMMPQQKFREGEVARICLIYQDAAGTEHVQHLDFPVEKK